MKTSFVVLIAVAAAISLLVDVTTTVNAQDSCPSAQVNVSASDELIKLAKNATVCIDKLLELPSIGKLMDEAFKAGTGYEKVLAKCCDPLNSSLKCVCNIGPRETGELITRYGLGMAISMCGSSYNVIGNSCNN